MTAFIFIARMIFAEYMKLRNQNYVFHPTNNQLVRGDVKCPQKDIEL